MDARTSHDMQHITDQDTARRALNKVRDDLISAADNLSTATEILHDDVVKIRPQGLLTVDEMAEALGRDRNYVDSVWSSFGSTTKGKQTRVPVAEGTDPEKARRAFKSLAAAADFQKRAQNRVADARAARDLTVVKVYAAKILGPSAIAASVGVDRNHVLRIARKAGVAPAHRTGSKNQYTVQS